jgi:hypothetical protein
MIHTSLSRTAHAFAINWSESDHWSLLPGKLPIVKRLLLGVATVAIAVVAGFAAGRSLPSASIAVPASAPSVAAADPELPATITLAEPKLANLQLQIGQAKAGPLVHAVSATGRRRPLRPGRRARRFLRLSASMASLMASHFEPSGLRRQYVCILVDIFPLIKIGRGSGPFSLHWELRNLPKNRSR